MAAARPGWLSRTGRPPRRRRHPGRAVPPPPAESRRTRAESRAGIKPADLRSTARRDRDLRTRRPAGGHDRNRDRVRHGAGVRGVCGACAPAARQDWHWPDGGRHSVRDLVHPARNQVRRADSHGRRVCGDRSNLSRPSRSGITTRCGGSGSGTCSRSASDPPSSSAARGWPPRERTATLGALIIFIATWLSVAWNARHRARALRHRIAVIDGLEEQR